MNMVAHSDAKEDSTELVELEVTVDTMQLIYIEY